LFKKIAKFCVLCAAPLLLVALGLAFFLSDTWTRIKRARQPSHEAPPNGGEATPYLRPTNASIVIPNWNGRDLLEKFLPSVVEACRAEDEIIVVDNASTDGSAAFVRQHFPQVRVLTMEHNLGFGGGSNAGIRAARHPVAILLNNDMRVTPGFVAALLAGFTDGQVFAVSAQIFFSDPTRRREETGLTSGCFTKGFIRVRHEIDERIDAPYPTLYAGGGSSAYDREKFLELGGFDLLFEPFYLEDTDLSYNAWKRGWKVLYQPQARVFHEHRGTIGKHFPPHAIQTFLEKNYVLMVWKNVHHAGWLCSHLIHLYGHMLLNALGKKTPTRTSIGSFLMALRQFPQALRARRVALRRAAISDPAVFDRQRPSIFHDRFRAVLSCGDQPSPRAASGEDARLNILFVSPYAIYPPLHGGAVFMLQALQELSKRHNLFVLTFVDTAAEAAEQRLLEQWVRRVEVLVRKHQPSQPFHIHSHAEQTFRDAEFAALLDKMVYLHDIDLIQFEYTQLAQYHLPLRRVPQCLFEHDIYFRSVGRQLLTGSGSWIAKSQELLEWLRGLRYEVSAVEQFDAVFTCHEQEENVLRSLVRDGRPWILPGLRTAVEVGRYRFPGGPREPDSLLFVGNFQHRPNAEGLAYFTSEIFPRIRARRPSATLNVVGAGAPVNGFQPGEGVRVLGQVPDIQEPLGRFAAFVCPIRTGAGVRVKILEAFASGIPVVSTSLGAEGISVKSGHDVILADTPEPFAEGCLRLLEQPDLARSIAANARRLVEEKYDWPIVMAKLDATYRVLVRQQRGAHENRPCSVPDATPVSHWPHHPSE
jgi:GT2 family glycosyltransferase/glycosyltransferase involved in cell wall biosynthesis